MYGKYILVGSIILVLNYYIYTTVQYFYWMVAFEVGMALTLMKSFIHWLSRSKRIKFDWCTKIDYTTTLDAIDWSNPTLEEYSLKVYIWTTKLPGIREADDGVRINKRHEVGYDVELLEKVNYEKMKWRNDLIHL